MKALLLLAIAWAALLGPRGAHSSGDADGASFLKCKEGSVVLRFIKRGEAACVRWRQGSTVATLAAYLSALSGATHPVMLRTKRGLFSKALFHSGKVEPNTPLDSLVGKTLEAWQGDGSMLQPLETHFLYVLPRVDISNYALIHLQEMRHIRDMNQVKALLKGAAWSTVSWLKRKDGGEVYLIQPDNQTLAALFPTLGYRHVEFKDAENGLLRHHAATVTSVPSKAASSYCDAEVDVWISPRGREQMQMVLESEAKPAELVLLLMRRAESDEGIRRHTLVLVELIRGPRDEAVIHEVPIDTEHRGAPLLASSEKKGSGFDPSNLFTDNTRTISRIGGYLMKTRKTRNLIRKFATFEGIDLEEAYSFYSALGFDEEVFGSIQEFFVRPINTYVLRPVDPTAVLVAPADAAIQNSFYVVPASKDGVVDGRVPQVKGTTFSLSEFLFGPGSEKKLKLVDPNNRLYVSIHYLAPTDFHRFSSAADWKALRHVYVPGCLPSVRRSVLSSRDVLGSFERTSIQGHWNPGNAGGPRLFFSMTLVGAMMVGGVELYYRRNMDSNKFRSTPACSMLKESFVYEYNEPVDLCMGQEMGTFKFGSTVVVIFEAPRDFELHAPTCEHLDVNSTIGTMSDLQRRTLPRCDFTYGNYNGPIEYLKYLQSIKNPKTSGREENAEPPVEEDTSSNATTDAPSIEQADAASSTGQPVGSEGGGKEAATGAPDPSTGKRGTEEGEAPKSVLVGNGGGGHSAHVKKIVGDETNFSSLVDVEGKIRVVESGLLRRHALAHWLRREWQTESRGTVTLQVGQLRLNEMDSSGAELPTCHYDGERRSLLLRFEGRRSNMLLKMPARNKDPVLTEFPYFACVSNDLWGKKTRGVSAVWTRAHDHLKLSFRLSLGVPTGLRRGQLEAHIYTFRGTLQRSKGAHNGGGGTGAGEAHTTLEAWGFNSYILSAPIVKREVLGSFVITYPTGIPFTGSDGLALGKGGQSSPDKKSG